ncbi:hypothetical protein U1Q18_049244 [Sarracenia purpurea var. burkii]
MQIVETDGVWTTIHRSISTSTFTTAPLSSSIPASATGPSLAHVGVPSTPHVPSAPQNPLNLDYVVQTVVYSVLGAFSTAPSTQAIPTPTTSNPLACFYRVTKPFLRPILDPSSTTPSNDQSLVLSINKSLEERMSSGSLTSILLFLLSHFEWIKWKRQMQA